MATDVAQAGIRDDAAPTDWIATAGWAVLGAVLVLVLATFRDYGISWDEKLQNTYGEKLISMYASGFADRSALTYVNLYLYGGLFDMLAALANMVSPFGEYETRHLLGGLVFVGGLVGGLLLAHLLAGPRAGLIALICLASTPLLYGHGFINPKDSPFAWLTLWALYYACRILAAPDAPRHNALVGFGLALGLALGTRVMAFAIIIYIGAIYLALAWARTKKPLPALLALYRLCLPVAMTLLLALVVMAFFWPWSVTAPLNIIDALETFSHFTWQPKVLWMGELVPSTDLPPVYLNRLLFFQLPEHVLAGLVAALVFAVLHVRRAGLDPRDARVRQYALMIMAAAVPLIGFAILRPVVYNGLRHFLFVVPPLVILGAIGIDRLFAATWVRRPVLAGVVAAGLTAGVAWQGAEMIKLHPYEYISFNLLEGGIEGAEKSFELDYWGTSLGEVTKGLAAYIKRQPGAPATPRIFVCGDRTSVAYFLPKGMEVTDKRADADYLVGTNDPPCREHFENPKDAVFSVQRNGVALGYAVDLRKNPKP
ncbi:MAG: glycosyltransferase family 39 protein [Rhodospirillaceae bacterium]|nr:glycosyltransferase family 39 protein [Rhodospirillaceae bacterium]